MADTLAAIAIALLIWGTMLPLAIYSGHVLLQVSKLSENIQSKRKNNILFKLSVFVGIFDHTYSFSLYDFSELYALFIIYIHFQTCPRAVMNQVDKCMREVRHIAIYVA